MNSVGKNLSKWIKEPSTWFSLVAFLTSLITFYFNWPRTASLQVYLPDKVPIQFFGRSNALLNVLLPIYIYNTGSPGNTAIVKKATARIRFLPGNGTGEDIGFTWDSTGRLVTASEYKAKNPDEKSQEGVPDYFVEESRDIPFAISWKETAFKYFHFFQEKPITDLTPPVALEVSVALTTMDGKTYRLGGLRYGLSEADLADSINKKVFKWIPRQQ
jgi:hypothetical protein